VRARGLGRGLAAETGFRLFSDPDTVRAPDVAFVRAERIAEARLPTGFWPGAPDLAVEVLSPSDTADEVGEKVAEYLRAGTELVVLVYPRTRPVGLFRPDSTARFLTEDETLALGEPLPGFTCRVADLFDLS
jgi:Uma2 family endonuclease